MTTAEPTAMDPTDLATRRRAEILYGAIRVISRDGVAAAKLKDIARESGVSLGLIQHYFDNRENLVDEAFGAMMRVVSREGGHRREESDDPLRLIFRMVLLHVHGTVDFPERWGFWSELWATSGRSRHLRGVATRVYASWAEPIEGALRRLEHEKRLPDGSDPRRLTTGILALMDGLAVRTLAEPEVFTSQLMLEVLTEWVAVQLGVDPLEAHQILSDLADDSAPAAPVALSPEVIATAL
ncbi:TetR/AcrR family transcriptional regulator [Leucobacter sp. USHLN153]|uniref:TetR/AcrR family transcriptional regulator n=1 Tax=Leucobacter sp. USHLN153 TaxID=3081268 RepID=UPI00301A712A